MITGTLGAARHSRELLTLIGRAMLGALGAAVSLALLFYGMPSRVRKMGRRSFDLAAVIGFAALHLALFLPLCLTHTPLHADVPAFYLPQAREALAGRIPYLDFHSSYGPLHPYLGALALRVWNNGYALLLLAIVCDVAGFPFWMAALRRWLPETDARTAGLMVMVQPVLLWNIAADGRNDAMIFLLLGMAACFVARRDFLSGMAATAPLIAVKFLPILLLPQYLFVARRRWLWLAGGSLLPLCIFGWLLLHGGDILQPLKSEGILATAGGAPYAWTALTGIPVPASLSNLVLVAAYLLVAAMFLWTSLRNSADTDRIRTLMTGVLALMLVLLFFSKKSYPTYLVSLAFPLAACVLHARRRGRWMPPVAYATLLVSSMMQSSLWYGPMKLEGALALHADLISGSAVAAAETAMMVLPAICYLYLLVLAVRSALPPRAA